MRYALTGLSCLFAGFALVGPVASCPVCVSCSTTCCSPDNCPTGCVAVCIRGELCKAHCWKPGVQEPVGLLLSDKMNVNGNEVDPKEFIEWLGELSSDFDTAVSGSGGQSMTRSYYDEVVADVIADVAGDYGLTVTITLE
jgi:hypothetical protein